MRLPDRVGNRVLFSNATLGSLQLDSNLGHRFTQRPHLGLICAPARAYQHHVRHHVGDRLELSLEETGRRRRGTRDLLPELRQRLLIALRLRHSLDDGVQSLDEAYCVLEGLELGEASAVNLGSQLVTGWEM